MVPDRPLLCPFQGTECGEHCALYMKRSDQCAFWDIAQALTDLSASAGGFESVRR